MGIFANTATIGANTKLGTIAICMDLCLLVLVWMTHMQGQGHQDERPLYSRLIVVECLKKSCTFEQRGVFFKKKQTHTCPP